MFRKSLYLVLILVIAAGLAACDEKKPRLEYGWVPTETGAQWTQYKVIGQLAVYQGDIVFDLPTLRDYQAGMGDMPHPIPVESYTAPNGTLLLDRYYSGGTGDPATASAPGAPEMLSGGLGALADAYPGPEEEQEGDRWVVWHDMEPTLTFYFDGPQQVDAIDLTIASNYDGGVVNGLVEAEVSIGGVTFVRSLPYDGTQAAPNVRVRIDGAGGESLALVGDSVTLTLRPPTGYITGVRLGDVRFLSGTFPVPASTESNLKPSGAWPDADIPVEFVGTWTSAHRTSVQNALDTWENQTHYNFVPSTTALPRVRIFNTSEDASLSCYVNGAGVPKVGQDAFGNPAGGIREMHVLPACGFDTNLHEIGHVLGLYHEQQRSDAKRYVEFLSANRQPGSTIKAQFEEKGTRFASYDYLSIMHYFDTAFGIRYCCDDASADMTTEGAPSGCDPLNSVGVDSDGDGVLDMCPGTGPPPQTSKTILSTRSLPSEVANGMGLFNFLSRTDVAAVNGLYLGNRKAAGHNALTERELQGFAVGANRFASAFVNQDPYPDLVAMNGSSGDVEVALGQPDGSLVPDGVWISGFCNGACAVGDLDGDGLDDLVVRLADGRIETAHNANDAFWTVAGASIWHAEMPAGTLHLADLDGDCRDDLIVVQVGWSPVTTWTELHVVLSENGRFSPAITSWIQPIPTQYWAPNSQRLYGVSFGDVDKDGVDEMVANPGNGGDTLWVYEFTGTGFGNIETWGNASCKGIACTLRDVNGDGRSDLVRIDWAGDHNTDRVQFVLSNGARFLDDVPGYHELDCRSGSACLPMDVDGDGQVEIVEPVSTTTEDLEVEREAGDVLVSRSVARPISILLPFGAGAIYTDPIGPLYGGGSIYNPGNLCIDPKLEF